MILEDAAALYRAMKERGLDLRSHHGRDRALLAKLAEKLNCPDLNLQVYLDNRPEISAEIFLQEFLEIAEPFAKMFEEIWQYLAEHVAPAASETISVRFGLDAARSEAVDLDAFRRYVDSARFVLAAVQLETWPRPALTKLFDLQRIFIRRDTDPVVAARQASRPPNDWYSPGQRYSLGELPPPAHPLVRKIHQLFQHIIDSYAEACGEMQSRKLPELEQMDPKDERTAALRHAAFLLTDLLPAWKKIFAAADRVPKEEAAKAETFFAQEIKQLLGRAEGEAEVPLTEALDILDLPFWRDRWHTYEIWASVATLRALADYRPRLRIKDGRVPLDGYTTETIADLVSAGGSPGCVAVQALTSFSGREIRPDLRICRTGTVTAETTAAIVEFKQREAMTRAHVEEVAAKYIAGAPHAGGVIVLNYDEPGINPALPEKCILIQGMEPRARDRIAEFERCMLEMLSGAGFKLERRNRVLLLDVSSSMGGSYAPSRVQSSLRELLRSRSLKIYRFNDGLVAGGDLENIEASSLHGHGGTQLGLALAQLEKRIGQIDRLLLVSDGEHDTPTQLKSIPEVQECQPSEIEVWAQWLLAS